MKNPQVGIVHVGDVLGGNCPGWELSRWELSWLGVVRWELSGWELSDHLTNQVKLN